MEGESQMFALCTFIDQPERWVSGLEPLLYPTDVSFYRPFSYRGEYFYPDSDQFTDPAQVRSLLGEKTWSEGFFGIRFRDETAPDFLKRFVPLRKVTITRVEVTDNINLQFRLGPYLAPQLRPADGKRELPTLELGGLLGGAKEPKLFVRLGETQREVSSKWALSNEFPPRFWEAFEGSLSRPAFTRIKNVVLLRLLKIRERRKSGALAPEEIESERHTWGYRLGQRRTYDISLSYYRILESGSVTPPVEYQFTLTNPLEELRASRRSIQVVGNYRAEEMWVSPVAWTEGSIQLALEPTKLGQAPAVADQLESKTVGLKIPALVERRRWTAARWVNLALVLLSVVIFIFCVIRYSAVSDAVQKVLLIIIAAAVSLFATSLKDVFLTKD
jgi:hypothetical protein